MRVKNMSDFELAEAYMKEIIKLGSDPYAVDGDYVESLEFEIRKRWLYEQGFKI